MVWTDRFLEKAPLPVEVWYDTAAALTVNVPDEPWAEETLGAAASPVRSPFNLTVPNVEDVAPLTETLEGAHLPEELFQIAAWPSVAPELEMYPRGKEEGPRNLPASRSVEGLITLHPASNSSAPKYRRLMFVASTLDESLC